MKWLFIDTYYPDFLKSFYLGKKIPTSYSQAKQELVKERFGTSDFYSYNLNRIGEKTEDIIENDEKLQRLWFLSEENSFSSTIFRKLPLSKQLKINILSNKIIKEKTLLNQVKEKKPEILYIKTLSFLTEDLLIKLKKHTKLLVGQVAYTLPKESILKHFDLIISSLPNLVEYFRKLGISSEYLPYAFDERVLKEIKQIKEKYNVVFIGGFVRVHTKGTSIIENVSKQIPIDAWGYGINSLTKDSPLRNKYHGQAWGVKMYKVLASSKISLNRHSSIAQHYANNMRMFEATGVGSLLITEDKKNIRDFFEPGKEIVTYKSSQELKEKIRYYLKNESQRKKIAQAGQKRTLKNHTYLSMMKKLKTIVYQYV